MFRSDSSLVPAHVARGEVLAHLDACRPCAALLTFARARVDMTALAAWRWPFAQHVRNDAERRAFGSARTGDLR